MPAIEDVLHRSMDRKEFLIYVSLVLISLTGLKNIVHVLTDPKPIRFSSSSPDSFGAGPYGGRKKEVI